MLRTVRSYLIVDVLESLAYRLTPDEYSRREDAEAIIEQLREQYPDSRIREHQRMYDLNDPAELNLYEAHLKRLI